MNNEQLESLKTLSTYNEALKALEDAQKMLGRAKVLLYIGAGLVGILLIQILYQAL